MYLQIKIADDVVEYLYDVQANKKKEKKVGVFSLEKTINSVIRDHMEKSGYIPSSQQQISNPDDSV